MWLVKSRSETENVARVVRYSLLALIIFMLVCTSLAIILVSFVSHYSPTLYGRKQGILSILSFIAANYLVGLVAVWRSQLIPLALFGMIDMALAVVCLVSTGHHYHYMANLAALVLFSATSVLSLVMVQQTSHQRSLRKASSVQTASVNCYRHVAEDWYDYGASVAYPSEKDELMGSQMPYSCQCDDMHATLSVSPNEASPTFCTVETNEQQYLHGNRYAL